MSLDVWLWMDLDTGGPEPHRVTLCDMNITHNVAPMWRLAGVYEALYEAHGQTAAGTLPALRRGVEQMEARLQECKALDPPNGWGDADGALGWLREWTAACERHPKATIGVSR